MSTIRRLKKQDMLNFVTIGANAYAGMKITTPDDIKKLGERLWQIDRTDPDVNLYGLFRKGKMVGGMRLHDFTMRMLSTYIPVGGVGFVAVDLAHKKEHVCKEMMEFFIDHYYRRKTPMLALYPFRPDFYRKMGFGYGTKVNEYRIGPDELPGDGARDRVDFVGPGEYEALNDCYHRVVDKTHGMIKRTASYIQVLTRPGRKIVAYKEGRTIRGFLVFGLTATREDNWLTTELQTLELIHETREAFFGLLAFLHSQADQVGVIALRLQDDDFHLVPHDARTDSGRLIIPVGHETNRQGIGIMYRVVDTPRLFGALKDHNFNGIDCKLKITVRDSFHPKQAGSYHVHFTDGRPTVKAGGKSEVEISLDVAEFSSLIMGVVPFRKLHDYRLAEISNPDYLDTVTRIFTAPHRPFCVTQF